ncbi:MAG: glutamine cyclotransferase [Myxococcales bacterium]|nr:glutamine cyclotransferase [Myxococcales bacterium]
MSRSTSPSEAIVTREYGPFGDAPVHGVAWDGRCVWVATGDDLRAIDPDAGEVVRTLPVASDAGTAFDGRHLYQLTSAQIQKIDAETGEIVGSIDAPGGGWASGLTWAEGMLWVGQYRDRKIHCVDPATGRIVRTIESDRFVTGVTWTSGELWHATWEDDVSELRRVDPGSGEVLERHRLPAGVTVSGLSTDGERFFGGGGPDGRVRVIVRPGLSASERG